VSQVLSNQLPYQQAVRTAANMIFTFYTFISMSRDRLWLPTQFCSLLLLLHPGLRYRYL